MSIIKLLPIDVANQIAAGEVVQRPSSVVKELLENSVDSKSKTIKLIIKDAGKTLIQVIDDGCGMSKKDLDICHIRHSTSKISKSEDLFNLKTMGFRGEALSSIASVSHITIISNKDTINDLGNEILIKGGDVISKKEALIKKGTSISVKNLFYNIPARRNFLKSDKVELRHIIDEFHRVALINYNINFIFINNGSEIFNLKKAIYRERIIRIFGKSTLEKLVPINESTEFAGIKGFVFKPEFSKKTRATQFFFVNKRYVKNSHLNHAVKAAYEGLIFDNYKPSYFLCFDVPVNSIDVNIHPNKTEVKFDNDQSIYAILKSSIKHSLGQFNISPTLDFQNSVNLNTPYDYKFKKASVPSVDHNKSYNPFDFHLKSTKEIDINLESTIEKESSFEDIFDDKNVPEHFSSFQFKYSYIITKTSSGIVVINQKRAHQRILYENFLKDLSNENSPSQKLIFPIKLDFNSKEINLLADIKESLLHLGFNFKVFNDNEIEVSSVHPTFSNKNINEVFQEFINNEAIECKTKSDSLNDYTAKILSKSSSIKSGRKLNKLELDSIVNDLFACKEPNVSPFKRLIFKVISVETIKNMFL